MSMAKINGLVESPPEAQVSLAGAVLTKRTRCVIFQRACLSFRKLFAALASPTRQAGLISPAKEFLFEVAMIESVKYRLA
jgi:hypothetical protein